jgi:hypothetical protein
VRVRLSFNPYACDYGRATRAIREILLEWAEIDWFEPPRPHAREAEARYLFAAHNTRARVHALDLFADMVEIQCEAGGWARFVELCAAVRDARWDWKFSILKELSTRHAQERGWSLDEQGLAMASTAPLPGELFTRHEEGAGRVFVLWNDIGGKLDVSAELRELVELGELPAASVRESAGFYFDWARTDLFDAVKWQLAQGDADLDSNPFHLLVRCYRAGFYPFSFGRREVTLFRFAAPLPPGLGPPSELPKATLLRRRKRRPP